MNVETKPTKNVNNMEVIGIIALLVVQYLLGMITALFVEFPTTGPSDAWKFAMTSAPVVLHMLLGILILLGSIMVLIRAITKKDRRWTIVGSIGLVAILVANLGGGDFIGSQNAASSLVMAIAFIVAVVVYGWGILKKA